MARGAGPVLPTDDSTDALWAGSSQWQIEGLRRVEILPDKQYGLQPPGAADGPVKTAIFSGNSVHLCDYPPVTNWSKVERFSALKEDHLKSGPNRSNLRYGFIAVLGKKLGGRFSWERQSPDWHPFRSQRRQPPKSADEHPKAKAVLPTP